MGQFLLYLMTYECLKNNVAPHIQLLMSELYGKWHHLSMISTSKIREINKFASQACPITIIMTAIAFAD